MDVESASAASAAVLGYYQRFASLLEQHFGGIPVVAASFPQGPDQPHG